MMTVLMQNDLKHVVSMHQYNKSGLLDLFARAEQMLMSDPNDVNQILKNKKLAVMFYQTSTRTRLSFEAAMINLGGSVLGFADAKTTRSGDYFEESIEDAVQVIGQMVDCIVMRHFSEDAAKAAVSVSPVLVINGGNGSNEHPTQALNDLWTMHRTMGGIDGHIIGLIGDPSTRVVRSLLIGLTKFMPKKIIFLTPPNVSIPQETAHLLAKTNLSWECYQDVADMLRDADAIEILPIHLPDLKVAHTDSSIKKHPTPEYFRITKKKIEASGKSCLILHPGPRLDEMSPDIDCLPQTLYFKQVKYATFLRMALLEEVML